MLKIQIKGNQQQAIWVVEKLYSIGSATENNLVLTGSGIAPVHARLISTENKIYLKDNNSQTGCFVNGQRITQKEILPGDLIKLGGIEIEVLSPHQSTDSAPDKNALSAWRLVSDSSWLAGKSFEIPGDRPAVIGRGTQCDIVIPGTHLSRRHAELSVQATHLRIKDLSSANGTYLNDQRVEEAVAYSGDRLRIDVYSFRLVGPETEENKTRLRAPIESLSKPIERKQTNSEPRRWKTRPTSPGNRIEPTYQENTRGEIWLWLIVAAIVVGLIIAVYKI